MRKPSLGSWRAASHFEPAEPLPSPGRAGSRLLALGPWAVGVFVVGLAASACSATDATESDATSQALCQKGQFCVYMPIVQKPFDPVDRLSGIRASASPALGSVRTCASLQVGVDKHVAYMMLNPDQFEHDETPGRPGYSPEGRDAARQSNLFRGSAGYTPEDAMRAWIDSLPHRFGMLRPELECTAFAMRCDGTTCNALLNVLGGLRDSTQADRDAHIRFPGAGMMDVATSKVSWQFHPFEAKVTLSSASLSPSGPTTRVPADGYFNFVAVHPTSGSLAAGATITADMSVSQGIRSIQRSWTFTMEGSPQVTKSAGVRPSPSIGTAPRP